MDPDPFKNSVGHFWGILETRDYMQARFALVQALQKVRTVNSVQTQLDHLMDMLRLCRSDNMGLRGLVPALMLRLGKDQECYDFVKWWALTSEDESYDWGDTSLPYLDIKNANVFETVEGSHGECAHVVCLTLLKVKLLLDVTSLENLASTVGKKVPREILETIQPYVPLSLIVAGNPKILRFENKTALIGELNTQVNALFTLVKKFNIHYWSALMNPGSHLTTRPASYSRGSVEETQLVLIYTYDAWVETPTALEFIRSKVQGGN